MEFNAYLYRENNGGHRRLTVLGHEGGAVRFATDRRDARQWVWHDRSFWATPATQRQKAAILSRKDSAEVHRASFRQWAAHRLWEESRDIVSALRLVGAYCANWPLSRPLSPDELIDKINEIKPWKWSEPAGFRGAGNLADALDLVLKVITEYKAMSDEDALEREDELLRDDEDWVHALSHANMAGDNTDHIEHEIWSCRLRRRLLRSVRSVRAS